MRFLPLALSIASLAAIVLAVYSYIRFCRLQAKLRRRDLLADGWWICGRCENMLPPTAARLGHDCDLCTGCAEEMVVLWRRENP